MTPKPFTLIDALDILNPAKAERMRSARCMELVTELIGRAQTESAAASLELPDAALHRDRARVYLAEAEAMLQDANVHGSRAQRLEGLRT
jgi:hypothetical protein